MANVLMLTASPMVVIRSNKLSEVKAIEQKNFVCDCNLIDSDAAIQPADIL